MTLYRWPLVLFAFLSLLFLNPLPWDNERIILGLPINLVYQSGLCVVAAAVLWLVTHKAWPNYLDRDE